VFGLSPAISFYQRGSHVYHQSHLFLHLLRLLFCQRVIHSYISGYCPVSIPSDQPLQVPWCPSPLQMSVISRNSSLLKILYTYPLALKIPRLPFSIFVCPEVPVYRQLLLYEPKYSIHISPAKPIYPQLYLSTPDFTVSCLQCLSLRSQMPSSILPHCKYIPCFIFLSIKILKNLPFSVPDYLQLYLSIPKDPVRPPNTLSIPKDPVWPPNTCLSLKILSARLIPCLSLKICLSPQYLSIPKDPVHPPNTCLSLKILSVRLIPVYPTCLSLRFLSGDMPYAVRRSGFLLEVTGGRHFPRKMWAHRYSFVCRVSTSSRS
jgi:hypothetical protein